MSQSLALTIPFYQARLGTVQEALQRVRRAIKERAFTAFEELIEEEAISLHVAAMTSRPSVLYWQPGTIALTHDLRRLGGFLSHAACLMTQRCVSKKSFRS